MSHRTAEQSLTGSNDKTLWEVNVQLRIRLHDHKKKFFFFLKKVYVKDKEQTQGKAFTCSAWFQGLGPSATFLDIAMMI